MINHRHLRELIIRPALKAVDLWSESAEQLLLMTCAQESLGGTYLKQIKGPALSIYQMEPATYNCIWNDYFFGTEKKDEDKRCIPMDSRLSTKILRYVRKPLGTVPDIDIMVRDLGYASVMCRAHFVRFSEPLPAANDLDGMFKYYKKYYNTNLGDTTEKEFIDAYQVYTRGR